MCRWISSSRTNSMRAVSSALVTICGPSKLPQIPQIGALVPGLIHAHPHLRSRGSLVFLPPRIISVYSNRVANNIKSTT